MKLHSANRDNIGLLFHTLKTNADVYEEAAKTIEIREMVADALGNLIGLPNIETVITDMTNTWLAIDDIVAKVSDAEFTFEPKQGKSGM